MASVGSSVAPDTASSRCSALLLRLRALSGPSARRGGMDVAEDDEPDDDDAPAPLEGEVGGQAAEARLEK